MARKFHLDFDGILEIALKGVRRSSVFMGIGVNAAMDPRNTNYQLTDVTQIQIVPEDVPRETLEHFKEEFKIWIEACALREAIEAFVLFLDELHHACSIVAAGRDNTSFDQVIEKQRKFAQEGVPNKLNILNQRYDITSENSANILKVYKARNCLAHRNGRIGQEDIRDDTQFIVAWRGMDLFIEEPDGTRSNLSEIPEGGLLLKNGGAVKVQFVERSRSFNKGDILSLSTRDLAEICWFLADEAKTIIQSAIAYANANGVVVNQAEHDKI